MAHITLTKVVSLLHRSSRRAKLHEVYLCWVFFSILVCKLNLGIICSEDCRHSSMVYYEKRGMFSRSVKMHMHRALKIEKKVSV